MIMATDYKKKTMPLTTHSPQIQSNSKGENSMPSRTSSDNSLSRLSDALISTPCDPVRSKLLNTRRISFNFFSLIFIWQLFFFFIDIIKIRLMTWLE